MLSAKDENGFSSGQVAIVLKNSSETRSDGK